MIEKLFSVWDSKAEAYLQPFFSRTTGLAIRSFETAICEDGHQFARHPGDYTLFELATFNAATGIFESLATPLNLGVAIQFLPQADQAATPIRG